MMMWDLNNMVVIYISRVHLCYPTVQMVEEVKIYRGLKEAEGYSSNWVENCSSSDA